MELGMMLSVWMTLDNLRVDFFCPHQILYIPLVIPLLLCCSMYIFVYPLSSYRKRTLEEYEQNTTSGSSLSLTRRVQTYLYYPPHKRILRWFGLDRLAGDAERKPLSGPMSDIPMVVIPPKETVTTI